jgi:hypothetical protein
MRLSSSRSLPSRRSSFGLLLLAAGGFVLSSCSGTHNGGCLVNCATAGTVTLVLTATPPPASSQLSIQAFAASITGVSLTPSSGGSPIAISLSSNSYVAEFNRVTSDSTLLASNVSVPTGSYSAVVITFSAPRVTYCTQTNPGVPGCTSGSLASVTGPAGSFTINTSINVAANQLHGFVISANLGTALTHNGQTVAGVDLTTAKTFSVSALPSSSTDLSSGQLAHIDDVMGVVSSISGSTIAIRTATRGTVSATANASTVYECPAANSSCVVANQVAVMDAIFNSDGSLTLTLFQPMMTPTDLIEGTVVTVPNSITSQTTVVVTDAAFNTSGSVLNGRINLGDQVAVTLRGTIQPFVIVDKRLGQTLPVNSFNGATSISAVQPGMTVAFPVSTFTQQSGSTPGAANTNIFLLRLTRLSAVMVSPNVPDFGANTFPPYFGLVGNQQLRTTSGRLSVDGATGLTAIPAGNTVSTSALFLGTPALPIFAAQSIRAH